MTKPARLIAIEEHFSTDYFPGLPIPDVYEVGEKRLGLMDEAGIDMQILSLAAPGIQGMTDTAEAIAKAQEMNDHMVHLAETFPGRFASFACLPTQDPTAAADELERAVTQLGAKGALINGHTHGRYLDEDLFSPIWERAEALDAPIYLHPTKAVRPWDILDGYPELSMAAWGWSAETGAHALRIMMGGTFDRFPKAWMILGHMGESIALYTARIDCRLKKPMANKGMALPKLSDYLRRNVLITTSGVCSDAALVHAMDTMQGSESILFSVDYPYETNQEAADWINGSTVDAAHISAIAHGNAERIFGV